MRWVLDIESEAFWGAQWKIGKEVGDDEERVVIMVDRNYATRSDPLFVTETDEFGLLNIKALDSGFMKVIQVSAQDAKLNEAFDTVKIEYLGN